jgi:hypothetical protein
MPEIQFRYEIKKEDYAEASRILHKGSRLLCADVWIFWGSAALLLILPFECRGAHDWAYPVLVVPFAVFLIYFGFLYVLPAFNARRYYRQTSLSGHSFKATISREEMRVEERGVLWAVQWQAFRQVEETKNLFVLFDGFTIFIFAKRCLSPQQITELQEFIKECWKPEATALTQ